MPACDLSEHLHDDRDPKLGALRGPKPRDSNYLALHNQITPPSFQLEANGFVYDPAIPHKERQRLAKILAR